MPAEMAPLARNPVQDKLPMSSQRLGDFLHRFDPGAHGPCTPPIEESSRPVGRDIPPEELEVLLEQIAADRRSGRRGSGSGGLGLDATGFRRLRSSRCRRGRGEPSPTRPWTQQRGNGLPAGAKALGHVGPREQSGPLSEEDGVGSGDRRLALSPGDAFDAYAAGGAVDASHGVDEEDRDGPQRHKVEVPRRQGIVGRSSSAAARADRSALGAQRTP